MRGLGSRKNRIGRPMSLAALEGCSPTWAEFRRIHAFEAEVDVVATRRSGSFTRVFELTVVETAGEIAILERPIGNTLPACCPDRHINPGGTFCLGLRAGEGISDRTAPAWWVKLHAFILLQETAAETGLWPSRAQLSHGDGADIELAAEAAAEQIGVLESYREAVAFNTGPIVVALAKINQTSGLLRNGRSRCLCGRADRRGRPLLRRDCHRRGCPIVLEHKRRAKVADFWQSMSGQACCGTMQNCPLKVGAAEGVRGGASRPV
jgi:hypothetical protein